MIPGHVRKTRFDFKQKSVRSRIWKDKAWQGPEMCLLALDKGRWKPSGQSSLPRPEQPSGAHALTQQAHLHLTCSQRVRQGVNPRRVFQGNSPSAVLSLTMLFPT